MILTRPLVFALVALCPMLVAGNGLFPQRMTKEEYKGISQQEDNAKPNFLRAASVDRDLLATCDSEAESTCFAALLVGGGDGDGGVGVYSGCGAFASEKDGAFCHDSDLGGQVCCGHATDDCCSINGGAVAGVIIAFIVVLTLSIFGCCYCCTCCCLYEKLHRNDKGESKPEATHSATTGGMTPPKVEANAQ